METLQLRIQKEGEDYTGTPPLSIRITPRNLLLQLIELSFDGLDGAGFYSEVQRGESAVN